MSVVFLRYQPQQKIGPQKRSYDEISSCGPEEEESTSASPSRSRRRTQQIDSSSDVISSSVVSSSSVVDNDIQVGHCVSDPASVLHPFSSNLTFHGFPFMNMNINPIITVPHSNRIPTLLPVNPVSLPFGITPENNPFAMNFFPSVPVTSCGTLLPVPIQFLPITPIPVLPVTPLPFPPLTPVSNLIPFPSTTSSSSVPDDCLILEPTPSGHDNDNDDQPFHDVWPIRHKYKGLDGTIPSTHVCRPREHTCHHCGALLYGKEISRSATHGLFHKCCQNGDIQLPELPEVPEELKRIFRQPTYRAMSSKETKSCISICMLGLS